MSEQPYNQKNEVDQPDWHVEPELGALALGDYPEGVRSYTTLGIAKAEHLTNIPDYALDELSKQVKVTALDILPDGAYTHRSKIEDPDTPDEKLSTRMTFDIRTDNIGDRYIHTHAPADNPTTSRRFLDMFVKDDILASVHKKIGFTLENGILTSIPTPLTLAKKVKAVGVDIEFINETTEEGKTPNRQYLTAYSNKKYPVTVGDVFYYEHDINAAHLPAIILGGSELIDALADVSQNALALDTEEAFEDTAIKLDDYTAFMSALLANDRPSKKFIDQNFIAMGREMGIVSEKSEAILKAARTRLKSYSHQNSPAF